MKIIGSVRKLVERKGYIQGVRIMYNMKIGIYVLRYYLQIFFEIRLQEEKLVI